MKVKELRIILTVDNLEEISSRIIGVPGHMGAARHPTQQDGQQQNPFHLE